MALQSDLIEKDKNYLVSAALRNAYEYSLPLTVMSNNIEEIISTVRTPKTPFDQIKLLITYLAKKQPNYHLGVQLRQDHDYPIVIGKDSGYLSYTFEQSKSLGYIESSGGGLRLTLEGWKYYEEVQRREIDSKKAFVAMWFHPSMNDAWLNGFKRALEDDEIGFEALRIDKIETNNKIDDEIIAEIRRSAVLVADFTDHRGGVYFEAGFAMGLGIPVIWTCRESDIGKAHFDTRQYSHITWNTADELCQKLKTRIMATIPYPNL